MSGLVLRMSAAPRERLDLSGLVPGALVNLSLREIEALPVGTGKAAIRTGDVFAVSGTPGERLVIEGGSRHLDNVGARHLGGAIIVEGDVGAYAGRNMRAGLLDIRGSAGPYLGAGLVGGLITVAGSVGEHLGGVPHGERFGMAGGTIVVEGDVGARAGDRMRRGTIVLRGHCGPAAGSRMMGGTIIAENGLGETPGVNLRRGTLIGPSVARLLPTFADCGRHDLVVLRLFNRYLADTLGPLAPRPLPGSVRRFAGDLATIGKGEILVTQ